MAVSPWVLVPVLPRESRDRGCGPGLFVYAPATMARLKRHRCRPAEWSREHRDGVIPLLPSVDMRGPVLGNRRRHGERRSQMFALVPREIAFLDMFQNAARNMIEGSRLLKELMAEYQNPVQAASQIKNLEHLGDEITHDIIRRLNQTFITPIDREDIHGLAGAVDDILDAVEAIADRFVIFEIAGPSPPAIVLSTIRHESAVAGGAGIDFLGQRASEPNQIFFPDGSPRKEADRLTRDALSKLFREEKDPMAVIKWKEIYETFEEATDRCEDAANILERITLKHN